jgi:hypothetical protein
MWYAWERLEIHAKFSSENIKRYGIIINDVSDYINSLVRIAHVICNHPLYIHMKEVKSLNLMNRFLHEFLDLTLAIIVTFPLLRSKYHFNIGGITPPPPQIIPYFIME